VKIVVMRRILFVLLLLPGIYLGTASARYLYRHHHENGSRSGIQLTAFPAPTAQSRYLIFAPHPDDETLGCGGIIQQARLAGAELRIVVMTNGDGFRVAAEREFRRLNIEPEEMLRFGELRQKETVKAVENLGVSQENLLFLGYPDGGMIRLWMNNWSSFTPYTSPFTQTNLPPYSLAYNPHTLYCGENVLRDVERIISQFHPTDIFVTHPSDDHADHAAASAFVTAALLRMQSRQAAPKTVRLHYYLIHRGDWPVPRGLHCGDRLIPPRNMLRLDSRWRSVTLTPEQVEKKHTSILLHDSQISVMRSFLLSFIRASEPFAEIETPRLPHKSDSSTEFLCVQQDPIRDNLLREMNGGGDIAAVYACRSRETIHLRIETRREITDRIGFQVLLRPLSSSETCMQNRLIEVRVRGKRVESQAKVLGSVKGNHIEFSLPFQALGDADMLAYSVESRIAGIALDFTGIRFIHL
jgi:LmbE family N-acetylglucosaminyl deacetylase